MRFLHALAPALLLASCGFNTTVVSLDYQPGRGQSIPGPAVIRVGRFADMRQVGEFTLGTVRTPIGTPLEKIATRVPVESIVRNAFAYGLKSRRMLAPAGSGSFTLSGEIMDLECHQTLQPSAFARVRVNLVRPGSGQIVFSRVYQASRQGATYAPGSGSPVPGLADLAARALQNVVDRALDDRDLRRWLLDDPESVL